MVLAILAVITPAGAAETDDSAAAGGILDDFFRDPRASGVLRANYYHSSKRLDSETGFLGATAQFKALPSVTDTLDGKVEVRATNFAIGDSGDTQGALLEGYATVHFEKADLRIGKQIVAWGRADGLNPTDNLTPRDFVALLPFEDDQRFGTTAVRLDTFLSPEHTVTAFVTPFFTPSKVPLPTVGRTLIERTPAHTVSNSELGLRLNKVGEGFDWSVSYFRGFSLLPDARLIGGGTAAAPAFELHYDRINVFGADIARNYGRFGFRAEVAYFDTADDAGTDPGIKNPFLYWIAGVDRTFLANLNVNLQFFQRRVRHHRDADIIADPLQRGAAILNSVIDGQRDPVSHGISFRVSNKWFNDTLEAEVFGVFNVTRDDSFLRPLVTYAFNDHWKGTIGGELYRGAGDTQFGSLKLNRGAFMELRYGF